MRTSRYVVARALSIALVGVFALWFAVPPEAHATRGHKFLSAFGSSGSALGQLSDPGPIAVDSQSGDVYVLDRGNGRVQKFTADGTNPVAFNVSGTAALAVDSRTGHKAVFVANSTTNVVTKYSSTGQVLGTVAPASSTVDPNFTSPSALAVDSTSGDLYVSDTPSTGSRIVVFDGSGTYQSEFAETDPGVPFPPISALAIDGEGRVYASTAAAGSGGQVFKFEARGASYLGELAAGEYPPTQGVAADPTGADPHGYVAIAPQGSFTALEVRDYDENGTSAFSFGIPGTPLGPIVSMAAGSNRVYVVDPDASQVRIYGAFAGPTVTTGAAVPAARSATLNGTVNPEGTSSRYHFEYGISPDALTSRTGDVPVGSGSANVNASASITTGLKANSTYYYRLVGQNNNGSVPGTVQSFTTTLGAPVGSVVTAANITDTDADVSGTVDPGGQSTEYRFEYGPTTSYGKSTIVRATDPTSDSVAVQDSLRNLAANTTYHVRLTMKNDSGQKVGPDTTFTTALPRPRATIAPVGSVGGGAATVGGTVDPLGVSTTYYFSVRALNSPFSSQTATQSLAGSAGATPVQAALVGLPAGGTFEVRLIATSSRGTAVSQATTFSTAAQPAESATPRVPIVDLGGIYGCTIPKLKSYGSVVRGGQDIRLAGSDLGATGHVRLAGKDLRVLDYSSYSVKVRLPGSVKDRSRVSLACGRISNVIALRTAAATAPSVRATSGRASARLKLKVPEAEKLLISGAGVRSVKKTVKRKGTVNLTVKLTSKGRASLARSANGRLRLQLKVAFTTKDGASGSVSKAVTLSR